MEARTTQIRIRKRSIVPEGAGGSIVFVTPSRAQLLVAAQAADLVNAGPSETKPAGPLENKEADPKKSSATVPAGPSTDSASSSQPGMVASLFALGADLISGKSKSSKQRKQAAK